MVGCSSSTEFDCSVKGGTPHVTYVQVSLEDYCREFSCPHRTVDKAFAGLTCVSTDRGPGIEDVTRTEGCGLVSAGRGGGYGGVEETFDAKTGQLVGMRIGSDTSFGPCNVPFYVGGQSRVQIGVGATCPTEKVLLCSPPGVDSGAGRRDASPDAK